MTLSYKNSGDWGSGNGSGALGTLTSTQADNNIWEIAQRLVDLETATDMLQPVVTIAGNLITFTWPDASTDSITIPTASWRWTGEFAATGYLPLDLFSNSGTVYQVNVAHTATLPFDPGANNGSENYYQKILDFPSVPGYEISDSSFTPAINHANSYIVLTTPGGCAVSIDPAIDFPDWTELHFRDETNGTVTFEIATPGNINPQFGCTDVSAGKGSTITMKKRGSSDDWDIMGLLQAGTA